MIDREKLAGAVRVHRGSLAMAVAGASAGVSAQTISRVERGQPVSLTTYDLLCVWLSRSAEDFRNNF